MMQIKGFNNIIKRKMLSILVLIALIFFSIYVIYSRDKYREIESTDLSTESIGGLSLMEKYNKKAVEKKFGQLINKLKKNKSYVYQYQSGGSMLLLEVDKDDNIVKIEVTFGDTSMKTNNGMTKISTLDDIKKAYGSNFLEEEHNDFMGSGAWQEITYVDKDSMSKITFILYEYEDWNLGTVILSKY